MNKLLAALLITVSMSAFAGFTPEMTKAQITAEVKAMLADDISPKEIMKLAVKNKISVFAILVDLGIDPTTLTTATSSGENTQENRGNFQGYGNGFSADRPSTTSGVGRSNSVSPS